MNADLIIARSYMLIAGRDYTRAKRRKQRYAHLWEAWMKAKAHVASLEGRDG